MSRPEADWQVDAALVDALVRAQAPQHAGAVRWIAGGWDNEIFRVGDDVLARVPRRREAVPLVENEHRWLPALPPLPLPIPLPLVCGRPSEAFPHPWSLCPFLEGEPATQTPLADPRGAAEQLGELLGALHQPAPPEAPFNVFRSVPLSDRSDRVEVALRRLGGAVDAGAVREAWAALRELAPRDPRVWLHGDLHPSNVLVHDGAPSAVIDFGDLCAGDRAIDLAIGWMLFDAGDREAFFAAAAADRGARERSRGWALCLGLAHAATAGDDAAFRAMGLCTIERCCAPA